MSKESLNETVNEESAESSNLPYLFDLYKRLPQPSYAVITRDEYGAAEIYEEWDDLSIEIDEPLSQS